MAPQSPAPQPSASPVSPPLLWKPDWAQARGALTGWWAGRGLAISVTAPRDEPWEQIAPPATTDLRTRWLDPHHRLRSGLYHLSRTFFGGVAFPAFDADIGPGSLALFLGAGGRLAEDTVWYEPCIRDPERHPPLRMRDDNEWWRTHLAVIQAALAQAEGRYVVGLPDLIENLDTLAQLRGPEQTLMDLVERPAWVCERIQEINRAYFECYDALRELLSDPWGGITFHAFGLWGEGRTAKLQCDFSCMISPQAFRKFVRPAMEEQCRWLDNAMYHLDGTQAIPQLDNLLQMEGLKAIEWTPQAGLPGGGSPEWYGLYRRIKEGGKAVQAVGVAYDEVLPLLDAVGPDGMFVVTWAESESAAHALLRQVGYER